MRFSAMLSCALAALAVDAAPAALLTTTLSDVTFASNGNGDYHDLNGFDHGVTMWTYDALLNINSSDPNVYWEASGVRALTMNGAILYYNLPDPNSYPTAPGTAVPNKFSTFINTATAQFAAGRFTHPAYIFGSYNPPSSTPIYDANELNIAWANSPRAPSGHVNVAVLRLTLDLRGSAFVGQPLRVGATPLPGETQLSSIELDTILYGAFPPAEFVQQFNIYAAPEPGSALLLALGGLLMRRRQRREFRMANSE